MNSIEPSGPVFTYVISATALTTAGPSDLFCVTAPSNSRVAMRELRVSQHTEFGDAQAELCPLLIMTGSTAIGGGAAMTGLNVLRHTGAPTAGSSVTGPSTTLASTASAVANIADAWNVAAGFYYKPDKEERITIAPGARLVVRTGTPNDALTLNATLVLQEIGKPAST